MPDTIPSDAALRTILKSQYHAALAMLREAIVLCPDATWTDPSHRTVFWQGAYHALFFTHCYSAKDNDTWVPWEGQHNANQYPDCIAGPADPASDLPVLPPPYTKEQVLAYWDFCDRGIDGWIDAMDLAAETSGFPWYPIPKLELQLLNLRHIQHHMAQLADRVRTASDQGVRWVGARRPKPAQ